MFHALHKSASMFLFKFFNDLCPQLNLQLFSIHNSPPDENRIYSEIGHGFALGPLRSFKIPEMEFPNLDRVHHLIQVRDPRDILVSEYYSLGWLHSDQNWTAEDKQRREAIQRISIDEYVENESRYNKHSLVDRYFPILDIAKQKDVTIVRYEDMVLDFHNWLHSVLESLQVEHAQRLHRNLRKKYRHEFRPGGESNSHKRHVTPGDHQEKLSATAISRLNDRFEPILNLLNYPMG